MRASVLGAAAILFAGSCLAAGDLRLIDAVKRRDHKAVKSVMAQQPDVNAAQPDGATALAWASFLNDRATVELLLAAGAKVNTADEYGETPLTLACANGDAILVEKLLKAGADANAVRLNGDTALMIAAGAGNAAVVTQLIEHGANVNAVESRKGQSALMWAAAEGHSDVVKTLIALGARIDTASKSGFTALVFAASKNDWTSVQSLLAAGADPNYTLPDGKNVLLVAAAHRSTSAATALLDAGAKPEIGAPLLTAAETGDVVLVKKLLEKGANPNTRTAKSAGRGGGPGAGFFRQASGEMTALQVAAKANQEAVMRALIAGGADPKIKAQDGATLLMAAAGSGHVGVVKYAHEFDKDVKAVAENGATAMHASVTGTLRASTQPEICEVIRFLAEIGVPLDQKDARGRTPIDASDGIPIDQAGQLLADLIVNSGATPIRFPKEYVKPPAKR